MLALSAEQGATAQSLLRVHNGPRTGAFLQWAESIGDITGDGVPDILFSIQARGYRVVMDGATGSTVWGPIFDDPPVGSADNTVRVIGDWDGDGHSDFASSNWDGLGQYYVRVFSGIDGREIQTIYRTSLVGFAAHILNPVGDVNGDGLADLLVGNEPNRVSVYAAPHGDLLYDVTGGAFFAAGWPLGDLDLDGLADFAVPWYQQDLVALYSGVDGSLIDIVLGDGAAGIGAPTRFVSAAGLGDFTGDGVPEIAMGAPDFEAGVCGGAPGRGLVRAYDGATRQILWQTEGECVPRVTSSGLTGSGMGGRIEAGPDASGDGVDDLWVSHGHSFDNQCEILSGATGATLYKFDRRVVQALTGDPDWLAIEFGDLVGDLNGDGLSEMIFSNTEAEVAGLPFVGRAYIFSGTAGDAVPFCDPPVNSTGAPARLRAIGTITGDSIDLRLGLSGGVPNEAGLVFFSAPNPAGTTLPLGSGTFCLSTQGLRRFGPPGAFGPTGSLELPVDFAAPPVSGLWLAGSTWLIQAGYRDPGDPAGANTTNALELRFTD